MKTTPLALPLALAAACAALTGGCATLGPAAPAAPPTQVVRSHLGQSIAPASIALAPLNLSRAADPTVRTYIGAVAGELTRLRFTPVAAVGSAELLGTISVASGTPAQLAAGAPLSLRGEAPAAPVGAATGLTVQIRRRVDGTTLWEGRAMTTAALPPGGDIGVLAGPLARALFFGFPGETGRTIRIR